MLRLIKNGIHVGFIQLLLTGLSFPLDSNVFHGTSPCAVEFILNTNELSARPFNNNNVMQLGGITKDALGNLLSSISATVNMGVESLKFNIKFSREYIITSVVSGDDSTIL